MQLELLLVKFCTSVYLFVFKPVLFGRMPPSGALRFPRCCVMWDFLPEEEFWFEVIDCLYFLHSACCCYCRRASFSFSSHCLNELYSLQSFC